MACPKCDCNVTYFYATDGFGYDADRCSACGHIFYTMDAAEDEPEDYTDLDYENDCRINNGIG